LVVSLSLPTLVLLSCSTFPLSSWYVEESLYDMTHKLTKVQIGKTSSLVLTLSGVLKDILLVLASMFLFRDPVTLLQAFGYSIALGGLVYYKLGGEKLKEFIGQGGRQWAEFGQTRPALRKLMVFGAAITCMFLILGSLGPRYAPDQTGKLYNGVQSGIGHVLGEKGA